MLELLAAMLILSTGVMALVGTLDGARNLTSQSELKEAAVHRAQREMERIQSLPYAKVANATGAVPAATGAADDPKSRLVAPTSGSEYSFKWNRSDSTKSEVLVQADGGFSIGPEAFDDGRFEGDVHRFVTWMRDSACAAGASSTSLCGETRNYKRVTVVVRVRGLRNDLKAVWFSSIVSDPRDGTVDSTTGPVTECLNADGTALEECVNTSNETPRTFYLYDTPASSATRQAVTASHATHPTVTTTPDLMGEERPPGDQSAQLYTYSTDVSGGYTAGRALRRDAACTGTPTGTDNTKGAFWVTPIQSAGASLSGKGALSIDSHTMGGVAASVTLCLAVYSVGGDLSTWTSSPPTELGRASYSMGSWPKTPGRVSFAFQYRTSTASVAAGKRLGVRLWVADTSGADLALLYDHPSYAGYVQLNQPGS